VERAAQLFNIPKDYRVKLTIDVVFVQHYTVAVMDAAWPFIEDQFRVIQLTAKPPPKFALSGTETVSVKMLTGKTISVSGLDLRTHTIWDIKSAVIAVCKGVCAGRLSTTKQKTRPHFLDHQAV
jgi:hypothetical protein